MEAGNFPFDLLFLFLNYPNKQFHTKILKRSKIMNTNIQPNEKVKDFFSENEISTCHKLKFDEIDDYSYLTVLLIHFILQSKDKITMQQNDSNQFTFLIKKDLGYELLFYFKELFEHLTLQNLKIIDNELLDEWIINFNF